MTMPFAGISFVSNNKNCGLIKCLLIFSLQLHLSIHFSYTSEVKILVDRFLFNVTPKHSMLSYSISLISECLLQKNSNIPIQTHCYYSISSLFSGLFVLHGFTCAEYKWAKLPKIQNQSLFC